MATEFLTRHKISFLPVLIKYDEVEEKKKILIQDTQTLLGYIPTTKDFYTNSQDVLQKRQEEFLANYDQLKQEAGELDQDAYWVFGIDTSNYFVLDVDDEEAVEVVKPLLVDHPYYMSTSKGLPKIFFQDNKLWLNKLKNVKYMNKMLEVQKGQWSFMDIDTKVYNAHHTIPMLDFESFIAQHEEKLAKAIKPSPKKRTTLQIPLQREVSEKMTIPLCFIEHHRAFKLCMCLNDDRWDNWDDWFRIGCALKSVDFSYSFHIWKYFSMKSEVYDEENWKEGGRDKNTWENIKNMEGGITLGSLYTWAREDNPELYEEYFGKRYNEVKNRLEKGLFKINSPPCFGVIDVDGHMTILSEEKLKTRFRDVWYEKVEEDKKTKEKKVVNEQFIFTWLLDPEKRCHEKIVFDPHPQPDPRMYNLFDGFVIKQTEYSQQAVDTVHKYILDRLCGGNVEFQKFMLLWQANIVQRPWNKTRVCIVIKSVQGIGKNLYTNFFGGKILGNKYYVTLPRMSSATGRFNGVIENKLFVNLNEVELKDTIEHQGLLKAYITDETLPLERKNIDQITIANHMNFIATTNKDAPFVIEFSDRRFACIETNAEPLTMEEISFFTKFFNDPIVAYSFYKSLMDMPLPENMPLDKLRPETEYYNECKVVVAPILLKFLGHEMEQTKFLPKENTFFISYESLYSRYRDYVSMYYNSEKKVINLETFKLKMKRIPGIKPERKMEDGERCRGYMIDQKALRQYLATLHLYEL